MDSFLLGIGNWELGIGNWELGIGNWLVLSYLAISPFFSETATTPHDYGSAH
jgi:hypothetical protein